MFKRFKPNRQTLIPNLVIAQRVIDKMAVAATHYVEDETGEALIGLVTSGDDTGVPTIYVLETIAPDESAIREAHTFQQGDTFQDEMLWWFHQNWEVERGKQRTGLNPRWDLPLRHVGDWHRQPGNMIAPSGGDLMTAIDMLEDTETHFNFLLAPIVTLDHPATTGIGNNVNYLTVPQDENSFLRVDFWYIDKNVRAFLPINAKIYPDENLPALVPYPWHLINEQRYQSELAQLRGDRLFSSVVAWDADGQLPLEMCFMLGRQGASKVFIITTNHDYPKTPPQAYLAPFVRLSEGEVMYDWMQRIWPDAEKIADPPGWQWTPGSYLVDYVCALEKHLNMRPADLPNPQRTDNAPETEKDTTTQGQSPDVG